jgi:hypothetical protein
MRLRDLVWTSDPSWAVWVIVAYNNGSVRTIVCPNPSISAKTNLELCGGTRYNKIGLILVLEAFWWWFYGKRSLVGRDI